MPELDGKFFQGNNPIPPDVLAKLFTNSPTQLDPAAASQLGWDGRLIGAITIQLSEDGSLARRDVFNMLGKLADKPVTIPASKLWEKAARDITLTLTMPTADNFSFLDGGRSPRTTWTTMKSHTEYPVATPQFYLHSTTPTRLEISH
jgi:hypothetical protein